MEIKFHRRRTKIVCTIGPATSPESTIEHLISGGMDVARLNLSHGSKDEHLAYIRTVRAVSQRLGIPVAIIMDLPGPKYRTGTLSGGQVVLKEGSQVTLTTKQITGNASLVPVNLPNLAGAVKAGDRVLLDDGAMELQVINTQGDDIICRVTVGGILTERRGLVVPGMRQTVPFLTDFLREQLSLAISQQPDYIALSFVSSADDVSQVKELMQAQGAEIPVISKIERTQAVKGFEAILAVSDAIMVARGDLGVDMPLQKVPLIQKDIIFKCNRAGKPVITATQMLESMVNMASPTRAETTDVANAILDGTDATMLSAETSIGKYPVQAVTMMVKIAQETESWMDYEKLLQTRETWVKPETGELIAYSACHTAHSLGAAAIVALTHSGTTAARVAKYRPRAPILALTPDMRVSGKLVLYWGVHPVCIERIPSLDDLLATGVRVAREARLVRPGSLIVITGGIPLGVTGTTNLLKVEKVK